MDSARLDAIAYPTIGQRPVLVGSPQPSSNCALAGNSGLPAISMPAGFTSDGLPTGLELMGWPFSDARLVSFAYAFEQMGPRRRPPPTAPALINGRAPRARHVALDAGPTTVALTFDPATSILSYTSRLRGPKAPQVQAVVFRRADGTGPMAPKRVIARISGPDMPRASGKLRLLGVDLEAFRAGLLSIAVFGDATADPIVEVRIGPR